MGSSIKGNTQKLFAFKQNNGNVNMEMSINVQSKFTQYSETALILQPT